MCAIYNDMQKIIINSIQIFQLTKNYFQSS